jgi:hypothetical protein
MIVQCPHCFSDNVTNLSFDSNDFICNDCGEDFKADNGVDLEEDDDVEDKESGFIDIDPETALRIAKDLENDKDNNQIKQ